MKIIDIYNDPKNQLSLRQYLEDTNRCELALKNSEVYAYLSKLSKYPIRDINLLLEGKELRDISIQYDRFQINLLNCEKVERHKRYLKPLVNEIDIALENKKIAEIKKSRSQKGLSNPPKTIRKNKHSKAKITAGVIAFSILVSGALLSNRTDALDNEALNNSVSYSHELELDNEIENISYEFKDDTSNISNFVYLTEQHSVVDGPKLHLDYEDRSNTDKAIIAKEKYGDIIDKYAQSYGLDSRLVLAIATQERGVHSDQMDPGGATGLMQIQNAVWVDNEISAYNFELGKEESFIVKKDMLSDVDKNIQIGCMALQNNMQYMNYNIIAAIQCYNMGYGNMIKILDAYAKDKGITREEVLANQDDCGWLNYRNMINVGDQKYVEHVLSWMGQDTSMQVSNLQNKTVQLNVTIHSEDIKSY